MTTQTRNAYRAANTMIVSGLIVLATSLYIVYSTFGTEGAAQLYIARLGILFLFVSALPLYLGFSAHGKLTDAALRTLAEQRAARR